MKKVVVLLGEGLIRPSKSLFIFLFSTSPKTPEVGRGQKKSSETVNNERLIGRSPLGCWFVHTFGYVG